MKIDYQKEMEQIIETECTGGRRPSLLLHACCAPCASASLERLAPYFDITLFYYNPNIYPKDEYIKRAKEFEKLLNASGLSDSINLMFSIYDEEEFLSAASGLEEEAEGGARCTKCFYLRLGQTAELAKKFNMDFFATTLTISPHKNAALINTIGEELAAKYDVRWLPTDLKKKDGYLRSIRLSEQYELYRQSYCGCKFSISQL